MIAIKNARNLNNSQISILIENGTIVANGPNIEIPEGITVIDGTGKYIIPGFIDAHTHMGGSSSFEHPSCGNRQETYDFTESREGFLKWGVTAVRTCGDQSEEILSFRDDVKSGKICSPHVVCCGPFIQAKDGHPWATVYMKNDRVAKLACIFADNEIAIERQVAGIALAGVDFIKVFYAHLNKVDIEHFVPRLTKEQLKRVVDSAHRHNLKCVCHVDGPKEMVDAAEVGVDCIEHMIGAGNTEAEFTDEEIAIVKASGAVVDPTMISILRFDATPGYVSVWDKLKRSVKRFHDAGIPLAVGCDSGVPFCPFGESLHDEMECLAQAGIPNAAIMEMVSKTNAKVLGMEDRIGSLDVGKNADIVLLGSNPLDNIRNTRDIRMVMLGGKIVKATL